MNMIFAFVSISIVFAILRTYFSLHNAKHFNKYAIIFAIIFAVFVINDFLHVYSKIRVYLSAIFSAIVVEIITYFFVQILKKRGKF